MNSVISNDCNRVLNSLRFLIESIPLCCDVLIATVITPPECQEKQCMPLFLRLFLSLLPCQQYGFPRLVFYSCLMGIPDEICLYGGK
jgi:hypothetical protein